MSSDFDISSISLHNKERIIEQDPTAITDNLESSTPLESLTTKSLINDSLDIASQIVEIVNNVAVAAIQSIIGRHIVDPGKIGIINHNGQIFVVGTGRWMCPNPRANWIGVYSLTSNIVYETLSIIRVNKGFIGLAWYAGRPVILGEGLHVRNDRQFKFEKCVNVNQDYITHGTVHIMRIPKGQYGCVVENNIPKVLKTGVYVVDSQYFSYEGMKNMDESYINHQTIHIIRVQKSEIQPIIFNNKPYLLYEGNYMFNSQFVKVLGKVDIKCDLLKHSTITRFRIKNGEIGLAYYKNKPQFITAPEIYEVDSQDFLFDRIELATKKDIQLGSRRRIIVCDGEVGISYNKGKLEVLKPATYEFDTNNILFSGFLSTKQQDIQLVSDDLKDGSIHCETKDFVGVAIKAAVYFRISDPAIALTTIGDEKAIRNIIKETSIATLQSITRSTALKEVAQSKTVHSDASSTGTPMFFDKVHDEFISKLHSSFKTSYGIDIANIRVEGFKIISKDLADNIANQAMITAQTENKLANLEGQREIATAEQERDARVVKIKAEAEAVKMQTEIKAKNDAIRAEAEARADALKIEAKGKAEAKMLEAEAEARAIEMKAEAERKRAEYLDSTIVGRELALLEHQIPMLSKALSSVQKVVYMPPGGNLGNLLQLFSLPGMEDAGISHASKSH